LEQTEYPETGPPAILEPPGYTCWL